MERWDLVQSAGDRDDASWIEDVAGEALGDGDARERFLQQVLSPFTKARRDFQGGLRRLISQHQDAHVKEISRALGYLVVWPPGSAIRLGDIVSFSSGASVVRLTHFSALGGNTPHGEETAEAATEMSYTTGDVSVVVTDPRVRIEFARPGAAFFLAAGLRSRRIGDLPLLARRVGALAGAGDWPEEWNVVTEIVEADLVLFFVAKDSGAAVEFFGGPRSLGLTPGDETPKVARQSGMQVTYAAGPGTVPLFRAAKAGKGGAAPLTPVQSYG